MLGEKHRTKWAFAYSCAVKDDKLRSDYDIYAETQKMQREAHIALKEEPAKTREVITTPMDSYLRQSYLLWRAGKPKMPCPAVNPAFIGQFECQYSTWYGCVDAERFDHSIPAEVVYDFIRRLGAHSPDTAEIAEEEIECLKKLILVWNDKK